MCAIESAKRGRKTLLLEHGKRPGRKILIAGGGRCNFTNMDVEASNYLCGNKHFVKSALAQYTQWDFIGLVCDHNIAYFEKTLGQLFCEDSAHDILNMLLAELKNSGAELITQATVTDISQQDNAYHILSSQGDFVCQSLVIATGGLSMPKLGATPFGFKIAEQFGHTVLPTRAGLVPFTYKEAQKQQYEAISGVSMPCIATSDDGTSFKEDMLFTHRGVSGPATLQISSYWQENQAVSYNFDVDNSLIENVEKARQEQPKLKLVNLLTRIYPKRFIEIEAKRLNFFDKAIGQLTKTESQQLAQHFQSWQFTPNGTEGYRTAEVTMGGVDTNHVSSKTMESKLSPGLFFVGEVLDVTGWLGGYNFQWAWSSGFVAGQNC
ncbi:aminoacetone oxidase family FAD-binding enzyme [Saccharobesus litoralis]|uniref:Aminoacetone oxidase family FAD-binding enzyme n=2 Tax=Saccharobesus litoralis TaxID=2172099 RepID=A0A2S0VXZ1_9ALTE|nr:aminoacetone oxidase family FAD-binding enzyme [Saccharobesus litoralis]